MVNYNVTWQFTTCAV